MKRSRQIVCDESKSSHDLDGLNNIRNARGLYEDCLCIYAQLSTLMGIADSSSRFFLSSPEERQLALQPRMCCLPRSRDQLVHDDLIDGGQERVPFSRRLNLERLQMCQSNQLGTKSCHTIYSSSVLRLSFIYQRIRAYLENNIASSASSLKAVRQVYSPAYRLATCLTAPSLTLLPIKPASPFPSASSASFFRLSMC